MQRLELQDSLITDNTLHDLLARTDAAVTTVILDGTRITDKSMAALSAFPLVDLSCTGTRVSTTGISYFAKSRSLESLSIGYSLVDDGIGSIIPAIHSLSQIDISGLRISSPTLHLIALMPRLSDLALNNCSVTRSDLSILKKTAPLESLSIEGLVPNSSDWSWLENHTGLTHLSVTDISLKSRVVKPIQDLEVLNVERFKSDSSALTEISTLPRLKVLTLRTGDLNDDCLPVLSGSTCTMLDISNNDITSKGIAELPSRCALFEINLSHTLVDDAAVAAIKSWPSISILRLCQTDVTNDCVNHICEMHSLTVLDVRKTRVTPEGLVSLRNHASLRHIAYSAPRDLHESKRLRDAFAECRIRLNESA